ncbi:MAG: ABC transporter permease subunit [Cyanobacteria bacterium Co-bin13]|nr:ABC transporter permease subunit [Cyanobacteria bacterium Co-bin13]
MVAIAASLYIAGVGRADVDLFNWGGLGQAGQFFRASLAPDLSPEFLAIIARAALVTLAYAVCGTTLSVLLGFVGGLLAAEVWWLTLFPRRGGALAWLTVRGLLAVPRAIHELLWGLFLINILGLDPLVAVLAIAIPFGAIVAKVFSEILDETPRAPLHALINSGVGPGSALLYGLLPLALPNLLSYTFYRFECSLRSAAVLGIIGAGGLGYEIFLSLQSLRYEQLWTGFYALILLNGVVDAWSALVRRRMGFTSRLDLNLKRRQSASEQAVPGAGLRPSSPSTDRFLQLSSWGAALAIPLCFALLRIDWSQLWAARTRRLWAEMLAAATPALPTGSEISELLRLAGLTLAMSVLAIAIAGLGGLLFSFPAAHNFFMPGGLLRPVGEQRQSWPWLAGLALGGSRIALLVSRAIPAPIWALVFLFILFPGILPGALALAMHNFGILGRLMAEVNENLDDRPVRALRALGAGGGQVALYGILPQNLTRFLAYILYRWEVCMRETVIVGLVGAGGLGRLLTEQVSSFDYARLTVTLAVFVLLTFLVDGISQRMRQAMR